MSASAILHQLTNTDRPRRCFDRCRPCDALLFVGPGVALARRSAATLPEVVEICALQSDLQRHAIAPAELAAQVRVIDDDEWVALVARFGLNITW